MRTIVPLLAILLAGCLDVGLPGEDQIQISGLPEQFQLIYASGDDQFAMTGRLSELVDRFGRPAAVHAIEIEDQTYGVDGCAGTVWGAQKQGEHILVEQRTPSIQALWLAFVGQTVRDGERPMHDQILGALGVRGNEVTVPTTEGTVRFHYDGEPWPSRIESGTTWRLQEKSSVGVGQDCVEPRLPELTPWERFGPQSPPNVGPPGMANLVSFIRGPLGPSAYHDYAQSHEDHGLYRVSYTPPLLSPIPEEAEPATWILTFAVEGSSPALEVRCNVDSTDAILPELRPKQCNARDITLDEPIAAKVPQLLDGEAAASWLVAQVGAADAMGLDESGSLVLSVWEEVEKDDALLAIRLYHMRWDPTGHLVLALLPTDWLD